MIPVVLIHSGYEDYVNYSIKQACNNNIVYFIGNHDPKIGHSNYKFVNIDNYSFGLDKFRDNYVHLNTTPVNYELFCYYRWFILKNFMTEHNLNKVFYIDSDVLLFSNVEKEWEKYSQYDMTLLHRTAPISSYLTKRGLFNFCDMLNNIYENKQGYDFKKIESHFLVRKAHGLPGGVCDMTLFEYFHYHAELGGGPGRIGEMMQIIDGSTYDHNINAEDQDFEFNNVKVVKVIEKQPYVLNKKLNIDIKFNSIHFQGASKGLMKEIYEKCN